VPGRHDPGVNPIVGSAARHCPARGTARTLRRAVLVATLSEISTLDDENAVGWGAVTSDNAVAYVHPIPENAGIAVVVGRIVRTTLSGSGSLRDAILLRAQEVAGVDDLLLGSFKRKIGRGWAEHVNDASEGDSQVEPPESEENPP
jgi:hypothetical protein